MTPFLYFGQFVLQSFRGRSQFFFITVSSDVTTGELMGVYVHLRVGAETASVCKSLQ